eukprot:6953338-Prymnesium_polylepis.1
MTSEKRSRALSAIVLTSCLQKSADASGGPLCGETGPTCETASVTLFDGSTGGSLPNVGYFLSGGRV